MMSNNKEGVAPGSGKTQCSSVGEYHNREVQRDGWGNRGREERLWDFGGLGIQERENDLKYK